MAPSSPVRIVDQNGNSITTTNPLAVDAIVTVGDVTIDATGLASIANQVLEIAALDAIQAAIEILDNIVSGSEAQVDVVASLPAGTNAIGKLAANSGVDIGDVDVLSIAAGDNNIGNVDIASAIPAGTNAIGKLAANSGVDIGDVDVTSVAIPTTIYNGVKTVTTATTREALASSQAILSGVKIKALVANTGIVYVGNATVAAANGFALAAGEEVFLEVANLATVNLDVSVSGEGVSYIAT